MVRRITLALFAVAALVTGCGARGPAGTEVDAPGVLVFSGLPSGSYLHAMRPDESELTGVQLPKTCSPEHITRDGRTLVCHDVGENVDLEKWEGAVARQSDGWVRVAMPAELRFPEWANDYEEVDVAQWSPTRDRIAFVQPDAGYSWFSSAGKVTVADPKGSNQRVVARDGEVPQWSPDGKRLAFARCRVFDGTWLKEPWGDRAVECSLWTVPVDGTEPPKLLVDKVASPAFWSPDGRSIAFLRPGGPCETFCRYRIAIVPATGGVAQSVGPELVEPSVDGGGWWSWPGLAWLPERAPIVVPAHDKPKTDQLDLQRCVDIWNRAGMVPWPTSVANVMIVDGRCQITVSDYGGVCSQAADMPFRYWCPSHGAGLHMLPPELRVWNAHGSRDGTLSLFAAPKGVRLPLPKAPPYPMLDGYVIPFGKDDEPLADLKLTERSGACSGPGAEDGFPLAYPNRYPARCWWPGGGSDHCFTRSRRPVIGDVGICPEAFWQKPYDPLKFTAVKIIRFW